MQLVHQAQGEPEGVEQVGGVLGAQGRDGGLGGVRERWPGAGPEVVGGAADGEECAGAVAVEGAAQPVEGAGVEAVGVVDEDEGGAPVPSGGPVVECGGAVADDALAARAGGGG
ncbi:hypothetical protein [Streptomyces chumphonensis]|uniref:hypothetical protein n=1 Tax=Streptomyces chumphonensis TaxID=1214925 RepID=UPI001CD0A934|nr:hypothetical protein [Streptomyces chumphonensis]